jgi:putative phage-type endonuclease
MSADVLRAIVDHIDAGGTIYGSSPLVAIIRESLAHPVLDGQYEDPVADREARQAVRVSLAAAHAMSDLDLERRRMTLGSSDIAAVCGLNPWSSIHDVWLSKVHGRDSGDNERTTLGHILEPTILALYCDRYDATMVKGVYELGPEPWMAATPDGRIVTLRGEHVAGVLPICEAKLVGLRSLFMWGPGNTDEEESDAVPIHYLCQALWQIACTGAPFVDVSALLGTEFRTYRIHANPELQDKIIRRGRDFWHNHILTRVPPPVDGSEGASTMLKLLYPKSGPARISSDPELDALVVSLRAARKAFDDATDERSLCENRIKALLKDASGAFGEGWNIRYGTQKDGKRPFVFTEPKKAGKAA